MIGLNVSYFAKFTFLKKNMNEKIRFRKSFMQHKFASPNEYNNEKELYRKKSDF
jgi:hypothetical protein